MIKKWLSGIGFLLLILVSAALIFHNSIKNWVVAQNQNRYSLQKFNETTLKENAKPKGNFDTSGVKTVNIYDVMKAKFENQAFPVIGAISYPEVGINLPVFNGDGDTTMLYGAGTMKEGQIMGQGNFALASHHVSNVIGQSGAGLLFSPLVNAEVGQRIYLTNKDEIFEYQVQKVYTVLPEQGHVISDQPNQKMITLITCATDDRYRIVVQGNLLQTYPFDSDNAKWFESKFTQYRK